MSKELFPPVIDWRPIGDALSIACNKTILVWNARFKDAVLATVLLSDCDPRGSLVTDCQHDSLCWDDFSHWCYLTPPRKT